MAEFKVAMWNCGGLRASTATTPDKIIKLQQTIGNKFDVLVLLETHHRDKESIPMEINRYSPHYTIVHTPVPEGEQSTGVIILVHTDYVLLRSQTLIAGRLLNINIQHRSSKKEYNLSAIYAYPNRVFYKSKAVDVVDKLLAAHAPHDNNIILGDFNFVDCDVDKGGGMNNRDKAIWPIWQNLLHQLNLQDPYRKHKPKQLQYSFVNASGRSRIDRVYVNDEHSQLITQQKYTHTAFYLAHKIFTFTVKGTNPKGPAYWKLNTDILHDRLFKQMIQETVDNMNEMNLTTPSEWWLLFIAVSRSKATSYSADKRQVQRNLKTHLQTQLEPLERIPVAQYTDNHKAQHAHYTEQFKLLECAEIEGHKRRIKGAPRYEQGEPNIAFFAKLEAKHAARKMFSQLQDSEGVVKNQNVELLHIAHKFYSDLFTPVHTDSKVQDRLLRNITTRVTPEHRLSLDAPLTIEELTKAITTMPLEKSPGLDGLPIEFYITFWHLLDDRYLDYLQEVQQTNFPSSKNTSLISLFYKDKGEVTDLANYRPISLLNVDVKILTKVLANRLQRILPHIIHKTQTAVYGRHIDSTVHLIRDLIDVINSQDDEAALLFLDQEKAFDRVDHRFLFKTMAAFGIGETFISWVRTIYSNALSKVDVNGFFTAPILLRRGVRQGCPLSPLLYVLIIEVLALQLRANPNIVGFTVGGEKILSAHYVDDAVIVIKQNRCFKEVYKDLCEYPEASGAKVNYKKTKGLWLGNWRNRSDEPLPDVTWTNGNVEYLGIFVGNNAPDVATFDEVIPKIKKSLNYWKQFRIRCIGRARVTAMFHTSLLWYAAKFYPIPLKVQTDLQADIFTYVNYPRKQTTVAQKEMHKLTADGGIKLVDIKTKSATSKVKWLLDVTTDPHLSLNKLLYHKLLGVQKGSFEGKDMIYMSTVYHRRILTSPSAFYKEALLAVSTLNIWKTIPDLREEKVYYNPIFTTDLDNPLTMRRSTQPNPTYGELLTEKQNKDNGMPYNKPKVNLLDKIIHVKALGNTTNIFITGADKRLPFTQVTQHMIYEELITLSYFPHHSQVAWFERLDVLGNDWPAIWRGIHNNIHNKQTQSTIWEQVHLNFFTRYSYNKWHGDDDACTLCKNTVPQDIFHIILDCPFVQLMWQTIEPVLLKIDSTPITLKEMAFGLIGNSPTILLRNWITFILRDLIMAEESATYYHPTGTMDLSHLKHKLNAKVHGEIERMFLLYRRAHLLHKFERIFMSVDFLVHKIEEEKYLIRHIFP